MARKLLTPLLMTALLACSADDEFSLAGDTEDMVDTEDMDDSMRSGSLGQVEVIASFNPALGETPESVALDRDNNAYISMALTGEIRKIAEDGTQSSLAWLPLGPPELCQGPFPGIMGALAIDVFDNLYVGVSACDPANKGIWRITPEGQTSMIASLPPEALPNGIVVLKGNVYVADSGAPRIWKAPVSGSGEPAEVWVTTPLLQDPDPTDFAPGANGLQAFWGDMYVANAGAGTIVRIPLEKGSKWGELLPGTPVVRYGPPSSNPEVPTGEFPGCDDFAFDVLGRIYCTTDPFQTVVRINLDGSIDPLLDALDGVDGPTAAAFGHKGQRKQLYISNAAFPFFPSTGNGPSLMRIDVDLPGYPLR